MKEIILFTMLLIVSSATFSQQTNSGSSMTKQDYLQKSKNQKTAAWIMLGGGTVAGIGGVLWATSDIFSKNAGPDILIFTGAAAMVGSIPLFIASGRNKRKAMSLSFNIQQVIQPMQYGFANHNIPSLSLRMTFGKPK